MHTATNPTLTLSDRIRRAISAEAWETTRAVLGNDAAWNSPAKLAKRAAIVAACERVIALLAANPRATSLSDLRKIATLDDRTMVETRLTAHEGGY